ncbi:HAD family hydrolase [Paenibacillus thiaminolyticus]|uniref:HAD family hydrolase n=1 Tax=Paenibacillus thiaminolyticus TaxID=49283 RepID=UPI0011645598|nr:HAD family hydrolase [Paenibacillus thiaminolyticus]NGP57219.1 HAD family hydrolase [Paenibacillus thiaminolyticus]WCR27594.1 HAD family hydrolase [Paenibacillus thiaminolyticus]
MAKYKALFINFYGTLAWEDENILQIVFRNIQVNSRRACNLQEIGTYWWQRWSRLLLESYGSAYQSQLQLAWECLAETLIYFDSFSRPDDLLALQYANWEQPNLYEDARRFVEQARQSYPVYILSNTDRADIEAALRLHALQVDGVITSEDVRAYKPRPEMFRCALEQFGVKREDVLHIGDSLSGDVGGAMNVGIDAVWLNRKNKLGSFPHTRFICSDLFQLSSYLLQA